MSGMNRSGTLSPDLVVGDDGLARPVWAASDPLLREYYDAEWGMPVRDERGVFERLSLEAFQAGLSWVTILRKRPAFRAAFANFDPDAVAAFDDGDAVGCSTTRPSCAIVPRSWRHSAMPEPRWHCAASPTRAGWPGWCGPTALSYPRAASRRRYPHSLGGIGRISPGSQTAWLPIRGADNLLLPHGGHRHYRHPSGRLPPPRLLGSVVLRAIDVQMGSRLPPVPSAHGVIGARCGRRSAGNRQDRRRPTGRPRDESRLPPHRHGRGRDLA